MTEFVSGLQKMICWHPEESLVGEPDELGLRICGRCGATVAVELTRAALDRAIEQMRKAT